MNGDGESKITYVDLNKALNAMAMAAAVIKRKFPNLSVNEANVLAKEIVQAVFSVTQ